MRTLSRRTPADHAELARLETELTRRWSELRTPIVMDWTDSWTLADDRGTPWLYGPAERDPLRDRRDRLPIPRRQRRQLRALAELGVPFQRVTTAHELSRTGPARDLLAARRQEPLACDEETARRLLGAPPAHPGVIGVARLLDTVAGGAGGAAARVLDAVLDPIVFGVVAARPLRPGLPTLWFPLVAWRW